jgi:hypothetical protein
MIRRLLMVALLVVVGQVAIGPASDAAAGYPSVLGTGKTLGAAGVLESPSGEFDLFVSDGDLGLQQTVRLGPRGGSLGVVIWHIKAYADPPPRLAHAKLTMQRNGNLVFRDGAGTIIWQTHTAGTGRHNRLVVQDNGRFVIRDASGAVVWRSHTNPRLLAPGRRFTAGQVLSFRRSYHDARFTTLTIGRGGRLLVQVDHQLVWATHVSVPGSYLVLHPDGNLVLSGPRGFVLWQSHTSGHPGSWLWVCDGGFALWHAGRTSPLFARPATPSC